MRHLVLWFVPEETLEKWKSFPEKIQMTVLIILLTVGIATLSIDIQPIPTPSKTII